MERGAPPRSGASGLDGELDGDPFVVHARYAAGRVLGRGAQGVVGRVVDAEAPDVPLCAKVWRPGTFREQALLGEFALLSRLRISGVVRAHDLGRDERTGAPFLVEEYVGGDDAAAWVSSALPPERGARLAIVIGEAARALAGLHDAGFVHSDLKPAHLRRRIDAQDAGEAIRFALLDLGAAVSRARAKEGAIAATPAFAAPEVEAGEGPSPASDLFSLGALAWSIAAGRSHRALVSSPAEERKRGGTRGLRDFAPWVQPSVAELIEALIEAHPRDRPTDARDVLRRLGLAANAAGAQALGSAPPSPIGRERELASLLASKESVIYVTGPSGAGKSHLVSEFVTRSLLLGRSARRIAFPRGADPVVPRLVAFLRGGSAGGWGHGRASREASSSSVELPFVRSERDRSPLLIVLDALDQAPPELVAALDAFRCRSSPREADPGRGTPSVQIVAATRRSPEGASTIELPPLTDQSFAELCRSLSAMDEASIAEAARASGKNPGWLVASLGRVPLTRDMALSRVRELSAEASSLLAAIAIAGGSLSEAICAEGLSLDTQTEAKIADRGPPPGDPGSWLGELYAASLITRLDDVGGAVIALAAPALAKDLVSALASFELVDRVADALLRSVSAPVSALLATAGAPCPPRQRAELYERAATKARSEGRRTEEIDALLALAGYPERRTPEVLCRLERLTRDAGMGALHPQVLGWLDEAATKDPRVRPLALRRRAEKSAREGDTEAARAQAEEALAAARSLGDPAAEAFSLATLGLVGLFRASYREASRWLLAARSMVSAGAGADDAEEIARLDHNAGVVALYRGHIDEAVATFERSLAVKRSLGDRAGMRSCLMNLGIALGRASRFEEAYAALDEAIKLSVSLGQLSGRGWCLFARAEIEVERGDACEAARWIEEALAIGAALPAAIRADLLILRARAALLDGDGARALAELGALDAALLAGDPLLETRARLAEAGAYLAKLPADPRRAARLAIEGARRARSAMLGEMEAKALALLRKARSRGALKPAAARSSSSYSEPMRPQSSAEEALWAWLATAATSGSVASSALDLARLLVERAGAERAIIAVLDPSGRALDAWGADLDGLELAEAPRRLDAAAARAALNQRAPVVLRDVETAGGRGSRLVIASPEPSDPGAPRAVVALEHRFYAGRFDAITAAEAERWAILAAVVARLHAAGARTGEPTTLGAAGAPRSAPSDPESLRSLGAPGITTITPASEPRRSFPEILGKSPALRRALARLDAAIDSDLPVLFVGETGSGKELFSRALHDLGPRRGKELVVINCGAVPDALFEAELFGHARGSFTGASSARAGLLARAEGGTLLLDELGELPLLRQAALLRALEVRRYRPVGSDEERPFNVRIAAATNRDLEQAVQERAFRQDLLYRVNAIEIRVPALRDREGDVELLASAFLARSGSTTKLSPRALAAMNAYAWPGNVRELLHIMQRLSALGVDRIDLEHLPRPIRAAFRPASSLKSAAPALEPAVSSERARSGTDEREAIRRALAETGGNISRAAERLGITRHGLKKRMLRLGMRPPKIAGAGASTAEPAEPDEPEERRRKEQKTS